MRDLPRPLQLYVASVCLLGVGILLWALLHLPLYDPWGYAFFIALIILTEITTLQVQSSVGRSGISVSAAITYATIVIYGPFPAAVIHAISNLVASWYQQVRVFYRLAFNAALLALSGLAAGYTFVLTQRILSGVPGYIELIMGMLLASQVDYLLNSVGVAAAISLQNRLPFRKVWEESFGWMLIQYLILAALGVIIALGYRALGLPGLVLFFVPLFLARYLFKFYIDWARRQMDLLRAANEALDRLNRGLIETLAAAIDARDVFTYGHSAQVTAYAVAIAEEMGLSEEEREMIRQAGLLHDIGKLGISEAILSKPGHLTPEEQHLLRRHPTIGAAILNRIEELRPLAELVASHHEHYDGRGYPRGLKGDEIPLGGRILGVADALEAMLSDRPYRSGMSLEQALQEIKAHAGTQFDPQVVDALLRVAAKAPPDFFKNSARTVEGKLAWEVEDHAERVLFRPRSLVAASDS